MRPKIIAHRGDKKNFPENTLISFKSAKTKGADAIELDVHYSKDKRLVVHHDYYLGSTDNGEGLIFKRDLKYIKELDAGSWFSEKFKGEKIVTLEEVFSTFKNTIHYEIELKGLGMDFIQDVLNTIDNFKLLNKIEITSPHVYVLSTIKKIEKKIRTGYFVEEFPEWMDKYLGLEIVKNNLLLGEIDVAHLNGKSIDHELVEFLHKNKLLVHVANCNSREVIISAIKAGADQLSTDDLEATLELIS